MKYLIIAILLVGIRLAHRRVGHLARRARRAREEHIP
jgi:hypothetical protein